MDSSSKSVTIVSNQWIAACQLPSYHRHVHTLFEEMIHKTWGHGHWHPAVDVLEMDGQFVVEVDLPGVEADNVSITADDNKLVVEGERKSTKASADAVSLHTSERPVGKFFCSVDFPGDIDSTKISKEHRNGVLTIRIPKKSTRA